ncbi:MAG: NAD(+)--rifampin ADP-ribosyltransferase [Lachnospiraceae bacterium]|nr:NAD(+)--rifampin ADP-ribosyltransferase [Lachnospiraceae bacterium]
MDEKIIFSPGSFFHGTKADLKTGDFLTKGFLSNYADRTAKYVYFAGTLDAAIWGAELAAGDGKQRIYVVEPTGTYEDDPNVTDKKFPGNPTKSYRTQAPLKIIGEVVGWNGHAQEVLQNMKDHLKKLDSMGIGAIE